MVSSIKKSVLKIAILGYGKMGKEIEKILLSYSDINILTIDNEEDWKNKWEDFLQSNVAIEFSTPLTAYKNAFRCIQHYIPLVCGTTAWQTQQADLLNYAIENSASFIYGSNFSIGANIFFQINKQLAQIMKNHTNYEPFIEETHHLAKKDKPSGTAICLAELVLQELQHKSSWALDHIGENILTVHANREGEHFGIHQLTYTSSEDTIAIAHTAHNRKGFALGAVRAALWLLKHPGIYHFTDIYNHI
jgi:4-hydroxy-tetrahydrodipicolinate reductase